MPNFKAKPRKQPAHPAVRKQNAPKIVISQCHVCASPHRDWIEEMVVRQVPYTKVSELLTNVGASIDRRSISRHAKEHLQWERAAIQRIAEEEARKADQNIEDGVSEIAEHRLYLRMALQSARDGLLSGDVMVTVKEALGVIDKLDEYEGRITGARLDQLNAQFQAITQAMREIVPPDYLLRVLERATEIVDGTAIEIEAKELEAGDEDPAP